MPTDYFAGIGPWLSVCLAILFVLPINFASAQQRPPVKNNEAELARSSRAIELIIETADAARTFKDLFYRARIQALASEHLWRYDETRARAIFRRAWEAATEYDRSELEAEERESGVPSTLPVTEARDEVLTKAAALDPKLAEEFLHDLLGEKKDEKVADSARQPNQRTPWRELSEAGRRRLALAYELLNLGKAAAAARAAAPLVNEGASADFITFLLVLKVRGPEESATLYQQLLHRMQADTQADAIDVLLFTAPIVSPRLLVTVDGQGALQFRPVPSASATSTPAFLDTPELNRLFYSVSANILLRPRIGAGSNSETIALYIAIGRLLAYFHNFAPQYEADLRLKYSTLINEIETGRREVLDSQIGITSMTPERPGDVLRPQLDQLGRARDAADRDRIALGIVKRAAQMRLWDRARRGATEIEDVDTRRLALSYIAVCQIADLLRTFSEDKEENVDRLAKFVRSADVPRLVTAWGLAQTAVMAKRKGDVDGANALLDEALTFAARTPAGTWQRVAAYTAVVRLAARIDVKRAWDNLPEVVRAANALDDYAGDEESIDIEIGKNNDDEALEPLSVVDNVFHVNGLFATMADIDYERALTAARALGAERPRAFASLAVAKVMLERKLGSQDRGPRVKG